MKRLLKNVKKEVDTATRKLDQAADNLGRGLDKALGSPSHLMSSDPVKRAEAEARILGIEHNKGEVAPETEPAQTPAQAIVIPPVQAISETELFLMKDKEAQIQQLNEMKDNLSPKTMREFIASLAPFFVNMSQEQEKELMEVIHTSYHGRDLKPFMDKVAALYLAMEQEAKVAIFPGIREAFYEADDKTTFSLSLTEISAQLAGDTAGDQGSISE